MRALEYQALLEIQLQNSTVVVVEASWEQCLMETSPHTTPVMCLNHGLERPQLCQHWPFVWSLSYL